MIETVTARVSVLPDVGSEFLMDFDEAAVVCVAPVDEVMDGALDVVGLSCLRMDSEDTLPVLQDERRLMSFFSPAGCRSDQSVFFIV